MYNEFKIKNSLDIVFSAYLNKIIVDVWVLGTKYLLPITKVQYYLLLFLYLWGLLSEVEAYNCFCYVFGVWKFEWDLWNLNKEVILF